MASLLDLSNELLSLVCGFADCDDASSLTSTCWRLHLLAQPTLKIHRRNWHRFSTMREDSHCESMTDHWIRFLHDVYSKSPSLGQYVRLVSMRGDITRSAGGRFKWHKESRFRSFEQVSSDAYSAILLSKLVNLRTLLIDNSSPRSRMDHLAAVQDTVSTPSLNLPMFSKLTHVGLWFSYDVDFRTMLRLLRALMALPRIKRLNANRLIDCAVPETAGKDVAPPLRLRQLILNDLDLDPTAWDYLLSGHTALEELTVTNQPDLCTFDSARFIQTLLSSNAKKTLTKLSLLPSFEVAGTLRSACSLAGFERLKTIAISWEYIYDKDGAPGVWRLKDCFPASLHKLNLKAKDPTEHMVMHVWDMIKDKRLLYPHWTLFTLDAWLGDADETRLYRACRGQAITSNFICKDVGKELDTDAW